MGTFAGMKGEVNIPRERLPELTERMMKVINLGGMMSYDLPGLFGKELIVLKPVELDSDDHSAIFNFNYFEPKGFWEPAGYRADTGKVFSNKIGSSMFNGVVMAMYTLLEFYSRTVCTARLDGKFFGAAFTIGWFNHLFDTQYNSDRFYHPWQVDENGILYPNDPLTPPVVPVCTEEFLYVTSDERAYFWRAGGDVEFSPEMRRWLKELGEEFRSIFATPAPFIPPHEVAPTLINTLSRIGEKWSIYFFAAPFYEFIASPERLEVQAAVTLLTRLLDGYDPGGTYLTRPGWVWDAVYSRHNDNFRAYVLRLYFAVLANPELRWKVFGF